LIFFTHTRILNVHAEAQKESNQHTQVHKKLFLLYLVCPILSLCGSDLCGLAPHLVMVQTSMV